jgi:hypothetical protein
MSKNRSSALKRDREAKKREKHAVKRQRREDRKRGLPAEADPSSEPTPTAPDAPTADQPAGIPARPQNGQGS